MAVLDGSGLIIGIASPSGTAAMSYYASGLISGSATATAASGVLRLASGLIEGEGTLSWDYLIDGEGVAAGQAVMTGTSFRTINGRGRIVGVGRFLWAGAPLPIFGTAIVVGNPVVDRHIQAVRAIVAPPRGFRYLQLLQRGDLPIYLCNNTGPVSPVWVGFTMYQILPCGARKRIGPFQRTPVKGVVGEFYAVGRAGESGQPGNWVIVWEWKQHFNGAVQSKEMEFQVLDAVAAADPRDSTVRCRKYGWN